MTVNPMRVFGTAEAKPAFVAEEGEGKVFFRPSCP
jgi:hypothetical protein